jgi:hypothetical protein
LAVIGSNEVMMTAEAAAIAGLRSSESLPELTSFVSFLRRFRPGVGEELDGG